MTQPHAGVAGPLVCDNCYGTLTINGVSLHTPAWCLTDLSELWGSFDYRGSNRLIPGRRGRKAYVRRADETRYSLPMLIVGYSDQNGDVVYDQYSDTYSATYDQGSVIQFTQGLERNVTYLQNAFRLDDPSAVSQSLFDAVFTLPSGATRTSRVQVLGIRGQLNPGGWMQATLEIVDVDAGLLVMGV